VTDHDTMAGSDSLRGRDLPLTVLPGVELSLSDMQGLHLLGYGIAHAPELRWVVGELARKRLTRASRMLDKLAALGFPLEEDEIRASCQTSVGRPHIARAMVRAGYVATTAEAFDRYIDDGGPAYVPNERLTMAEALPLLRRNGFVPVLAHPAELEKDDMTLRMLLESWQKQGLMGVEVYHPSWENRGYATLDAMVRRMGFLVTGGSDYHCDDGRHGQPGCTAPYWRQAEQDMFRLVETVKHAATV
jgi:predicted metal-dependent phosphoesterase TrpH